MPTFTYTAFAPDAFSFPGGGGFVTGNQFQLDPGWDAQNDGYSFAITDDDAIFGGDYDPPDDSGGGANEIGTDSGQTAVVTDPGGATVGSGRVYLEAGYEFVDEFGNTLNLYQVEIGGTVVGYIADGPIQPGNTYTIVASSNPADTSGTQVTYAELHSETYDEDIANVVQGTSNGDTLSPTAGNDTVDGGAGNDRIDGGEGADGLSGGDGDDTVTGGHGTDVIDGGAGNNRLLGGQGGDTILGGTGADSILGDGQWYDPADHASGPGVSATNLALTNSADGPIELWWVNQTGTLVFYQTIQPGDTFVQATFEDHNWILRDAEGYFLELIEGAPNQTVDYGAEGLDDSLVGGDRDDTLIGQFGNDTLEGGAGSDNLDGGTGNDQIFGGGGTGNLLVGGAGDDVLYNGGGNDSAFGDAGNDTIYADAGSDYLDGGDDADTFVVDSIWGAFGSDTIIGGEGGTDTDTIDLSGMTRWFTIEFTGAEAGTITDGTSTATFSQIEQFILPNGDTLASGQAGDRIHYDADTAGGFGGGTGNDTLYGNGGDDGMGGGAGDDLMYGGAGDDGMGGDAGADTMHGGDGNDGMGGGDGDDLIHGDAGNDSIGGNAGADTIYGGAGDDVIGGEEDNDLVYGGDGSDSLSGNDGDDTVHGDAGNDTLHGWAGNDEMFGGDDADLFKVFDGSGNDTLTGGEGGTDDDVIDLSAVTDGVTVTYTGDEAGTILNGADTITFSEVERLILTDQADVVDATALSSGVDIDAGAGDDSITGGTGGDTLAGGAGNDTLAARAGDDLVLGGDGDDSIKIADDASTDTVDGGAGEDKVNLNSANSGVTVTYSGDGLGTYSFAATGGSGTFTGIEEFQGTSRADLLNAANDGAGVTLAGSVGDDTLIGGSGADSLNGGADEDTFVVYDGPGNDTIAGGALGNDADLIDLSALTGPVTVTYAGAEGGTILSGADTITFSDIERLSLTDQADSLDGGADTAGLIVDAGDGNDTLIGGIGNDSLTGGSGDDDFSYVAGDGADTITDFNSGNTGTLSDGDSANNDSIDLSAFYDTIWELHADQADDGILNQSNALSSTGKAVDYSDNTGFGAGSLTFAGASADSSFFTVENTGVVCFSQGTLIATPRGEVPIETLRTGDLVLTRDNGPKPIAWIGRRHLGRSALAINPKLRPILIKPDLVGAHSPLCVSPQHGILLKLDRTERLVRARHLANLKGGQARVMQGCHRVTYVHLMFEAHEIVFANGTPSESFYPGEQAIGALAAEARREIADLFPALTTTSTAEAFGLKARDFAKPNDLPEALCAFANAG